MSNLPDYEGWAIFVKVVEAGSFSAAAAELNLSKATVSKALTRLETRLATPLFHRSSRRISLTESGRASLDRARRMVGEADALQEEASERTLEPRGLVRLTAPVSFGILNLGPILPAFFAHYPHVSIDLQLTDRRVDLIADGADVAVRIGQLEDSALRSRRLYDIKRHLVASPSYIRRYGEPRHPRDLEQHQAILFTQLVSATNWQFTHVSEGSVTVKVNGRLRIDNGDVAIPALLADLGVALMPEFLVWTLLRDGQLRSLMSDWTSSPVPLSIVTPPGGVRPARVTALIGFLAHNLQHMPFSPLVRGSAPMALCGKLDA